MATVLVLAVAAVIALRGHIPGGHPAPAEARTASLVSLVAVVALLAVALAGFAVAVIAAPRRPDGPVAEEGFDHPGMRGLSARVRWRWVLIAALGVLTALLCWLLVAQAITRLVGPLEPATPAPARAPTSPPATPAPPADPAGGEAFGYLVAATVILLLIVAFGTIAQARRRAHPSSRRDDRQHLATRRPGGPETLARAAELGLTEIADTSREPRTAIIACYAAMEHGLARAPGAVPQDSDTPSEVLARAVTHHALSADSATELVELFTEARFSPHVMTEHHRDAAITAMRRVLAELRSVT